MGGRLRGGGGGWGEGQWCSGKKINVNFTTEHTGYALRSGKISGEPTRVHVALRLHRWGWGAYLADTAGRGGRGDTGRTHRPGRTPPPPHRSSASGS